MNTILEATNISDLVERLRTCPAGKRKEVAFELARRGTSEAVGELIRMVDAELRISYPTETRYKGEKIHWWSRKTKLVSYEYTQPAENYGFEDQLIGIEALGETGSARALEYLKNLIREERRLETLTRPACATQDIPFPYDEEVLCIYYPNAKGSLKGWELRDYHKMIGMSPFELIEKTIKKLKKGLENMQYSQPLGEIICQ